MDWNINGESKDGNLPAYTDLFDWTNMWTLETNLTDECGSIEVVTEVAVPPVKFVHKFPVDPRRDEPASADRSECTGVCM